MAPAACTGRAGPSERVLARLACACALAVLTSTQAHAQLGAIIDGLTGARPYYPPPPPYYPPSYYPPAYPPPPYAPPPYPQSYYQSPRYQLAPRPAIPVAEIQRLLNDLGYDAGPADGAAGARTTQAVREFQQSHGQVPSGAITAETIASIRAVAQERNRSPGPPAATVMAEPSPVTAAAVGPLESLMGAARLIPTEGQYCRFGQGNAYDMLLVRDNGEGLSFAFTSWAPNGSNFSVSGEAARDTDGWRFASRMNARNPDERCGITIGRSPEGDYRIGTIDGARCQSSGGNGAGLDSTTFPAASRVGNPPQSPMGETLMRIGCDARASRTAAAAAKARAPGVTFNGTAEVGSASLPVHHYAYCLMPSAGGRQGRIFVQAFVPGADRIKPVFDFNPIEGPYPAVPQTFRLQAAGTQRSADERIRSQGDWTPNAVFRLELNDEPGSSPTKLGRVLALLADGPARLSWQLDNPKAGGPPLRSSIDLTAADAAALSTVFAPCLRAP